MTDTPQYPAGHPRQRAGSRARSEIRSALGLGAQERVAPPPPPRARRPRPAAAPAPSAPAGDSPVLTLELGQIADYLMQHKWLIGVFGGLGLALALAIAVLVPPSYTVRTEILVDPVNLQVLSDDIYSANEQRDALVLNVESKMRVLTSTNVLARVVEVLALVDDPEFVPTSGGLMSLLGLGGARAGTPEAIAVQSLLARIDARRDERSFVVTLLVSTRSAEKSVEISRAMVAAFQAQLAEADASAAGRAADALVARLSDLKSKVTAAEDVMERFRRENNLQSSQGELISTLSMTQMNTQLIEARARLIEARSRYNELTVPDAANVLAAAAQESTTLSALRTQYATVQQEAQTLARTLGPRHPRYLEIMPQVAALDEQMRAEVGRIVQAARTALDQAEAVERSLAQSASDAQQVVVADNAAQVQLRELERDAVSQAAIYEAFLARARQIAEREQLNTTNIRVISEPMPPRSRSWPPSTAQLMVLGLAFGLAIGAALAILLGFFRVPGPGRRPEARAA